MLFFVATHAAAVPSGLRRFVSVDGSVPGAVRTWDHHITGERVNLDAMPDFDPLHGIEAVGTTAADTDSIVSAVAAARGGKAALPPGVLEVFRAASHLCDHLVPLEGIDEPTSIAARGFDRWVRAELARRCPEGTAAEESRAFGDLVDILLGTLARGEGLPSASRDDGDPSVARALLDAGRIRLQGGVAIVDLRGARPVPPELTYALHPAPVAVTVSAHEDGGVRYTVGVNPLVPHPEDLRAALVALAAREHAHGPPAVAPTPVPGSENWGGRATVFGSPWNYGSRLAPEEVAEIVGRSVLG